MLIRRAELDFGPVADVRTEAGLIAEIAPHLPQHPGEHVIDAGGCALLPGLHDHHLHLPALAAALQSLRCGPPEVRSADELTTRLTTADCAPGQQHEWLRGVGYHESVAGDIDRQWLDRHVRSRPARIQHRSGRLWILNSRALERLGDLDDGTPLERVDGRLTGRLYDHDDWLRERLQGQWPGLALASARLAARGVTGLTEATPHNDLARFERFRRALQRGELRQNLLVMGDASLTAAVPGPGLEVGPTKIHLREAALPEFDAFVRMTRGSHAAGRPVAVHCVTRVELMFTLAGLQVAGTVAGDRVEHASVTPPDALPMLRALGLAVVTQPHFIRERGDAYLTDVDEDDRPWLYRARTLLDAGIPLAAGSDAPFGDADPWLAMQAAVDRRTHDGALCGPTETLTAEQALALFACGPPDPGGPSRRVVPGAPADLCLLDRPWHVARENLADVQVRMTLHEGQVIWDATTSPLPGAPA